MAGKGTEKIWEGDRRGPETRINLMQPKWKKREAEICGNLNRIKVPIKTATLRMLKYRAVGKIDWFTIFRKKWYGKLTCNI